MNADFPTADLSTSFASRGILEIPQDANVYDRSGLPRRLESMLAGMEWQLNIENIRVAPYVSGDSAYPASREESIDFS
jgi:hypothetical protein